MTDETSQIPEAPETPPQAPEPSQIPPPPPTPDMQTASPAGAISSDSKLYAFLAYLLSIVGVIIVLATRKEDKFALFHAKQGLVLFGGYVIANIVRFLPIPMGGAIGYLLSTLCLILEILGIINALNGQEKPLPIIGQFADKINL